MTARRCVHGARHGCWILPRAGRSRRQTRATGRAPVGHRRALRQRWTRPARLLAARSLGRHPHRRSHRARCRRRCHGTSGCARSSRCACPPARALSHATVIRVGQLVGAMRVIVGSCDDRRRHAHGARALDPARQRAHVAGDRRDRAARESVRRLRARRAASGRRPAACRRGEMRAGIRRSPPSSSTSRACWPKRRR